MKGIELVAKVKDPLGCREVRGSVGGMTFSRGGCGLYVKAKGRVLAKRTHDVQSTRAAINRITAKYVGMDQVFHEMWGEFGAEWGVPDSLGADVTECGFSWFVKFNFHRIQDGLSWVMRPPPGPEADYMPTTRLEYGAWGISFDADPRPAGEQRIYMRRFGPRPVSGNRVPEKARKVGYYSSASAWPAVVWVTEALKEDRARYWFKWVAIDVFGRPAMERAGYIDVDPP